ncbi:hypothetical protein ENBRE01_0728 [Enteropsectra breve]|nr:hypothetical protein ENBRE01_0728 [Enteropsectra breve]
MTLGRKILKEDFLEEDEHEDAKNEQGIKKIKKNVVGDKNEEEIKTHELSVIKDEIHSDNNNNSINEAPPASDRETRPPASTRMNNNPPEVSEESSSVVILREQSNVNTAAPYVQLFEESYYDSEEEFFMQHRSSGSESDDDWSDSYDDYESDSWGDSAGDYWSDREWGGTEGSEDMSGSEEMSGSEDMNGSEGDYYLPRDNLNTDRERTREFIRGLNMALGSDTRSFFINLHYYDGLNSDDINGTDNNNRNDIRESADDNDVTVFNAARPALSLRVRHNSENDSDVMILENTIPAASAILNTDTRIRVLASNILSCFTFKAVILNSILETENYREKHRAELLPGIADKIITVLNSDSYNVFVNERERIQRYTDAQVDSATSYLGGVHDLFEMVAERYSTLIVEDREMGEGRYAEIKQNFIELGEVDHNTFPAVILRIRIIRLLRLLSIRQLFYFCSKIRAEFIQEGRGENYTKSLITLLSSFNENFDNFVRKIPFPPKTYKSVSYKDILDVKSTLCTICYDEFTPLTKCMTMDCMHTFHTRCLRVWLRRNQRCPFCRTEPTYPV